MALLVFTLLGLWGILIYVSKSDYRSTKATRYFYLYLLSIIFIWWGLTVSQESPDSFGLKLLSAISTLLGFFGLMFFGVSLFGSASDMQNDEYFRKIRARSNRVDTVIESETKPISANKVAPSEPTKRVSQRARRGKDWYVCGGMLWRKTDNRSFCFERECDSESYVVSKNDQIAHSFSVLSSYVEQIEYLGSSAVVECPNCAKRCRLPVKAVLEVRCTACRSKWVQNLDLPVPD